jgi:hypothetical protein
MRFICYNGLTNQEREEKKMKTEFVYEVAGHQWEATTEAFGKEWKEAKAMATELHCAVYRWDIKDEKIDHNVFYEGGVFNLTKYANECPQNCRIKIF